MYVEKLLEAVTPDVYQNFRTSIETGKWPDGKPLTREQKEICIQAVIAYEAKNFPEDERTGYVPPKETPCDTDHDSSADDVKPIKWSE